MWAAPLPPVDHQVVPKSAASMRRRSMEILDPGLHPRDRGHPTGGFPEVRVRGFQTARELPIYWSAGEAQGPVDRGLVSARGLLPVVRREFRCLLSTILAARSAAGNCTALSSVTSVVNRIAASTATAAMRPCTSYGRASKLNPIPVLRRPRLSQPAPFTDPFAGAASGEQRTHAGFLARQA
jgi:hypothetical protein